MQYFGASTQNTMILCSISVLTRNYRFITIRNENFEMIWKIWNIKSEIPQHMVKISTNFCQTICYLNKIYGYAIFERFWKTSFFDGYLLISRLVIKILTKFFLILFSFIKIDPCAIFDRFWKHSVFWWLSADISACDQNIDKTFQDYVFLHQN